MSVLTACLFPLFYLSNRLERIPCYPAGRIGAGSFFVSKGSKNIEKVLDFP